MSCMFPQFVYQLRLDYCCHYLSARDLSLPPRRTSTSGNCLTLVTLLFDFTHYQKPSRLILRLYDFLTTRRTRIYLPLSEIPGPRQKAGAAHKLKPLSIPPVTSGNLRDLVFAPGSLGLTRNNWDRRDECFQFPESRFFRSGPLPRFLLFSQAVEGAGYMREVGDEPTVEVYKAHKGLNFGDVLWGWQVLDAGDFDGIHFYMTFGED